MELANTRGIVTCCFGDRRKQLTGLISNIRKYTDLPITVITDRDINLAIGPAPVKDITLMKVKGLWQGHPRYGQRNGDYWQARGSLECEYDEVLYLDDDMRIVSKDFMQGFDIADRFGVCLPLNPRHNIGVDGKIGADSAGYPKGWSKATAYNCGTMFVYKEHDDVRLFLREWVDIMTKTPTRGPMAVFYAATAWDYTPYVLSPEWCVCGRDANIENPIILHCGHKPCMDRYNKEFK